MAIYAKKTGAKLALCTIGVDPGCFVGDRTYRIIASLEKPRIFYISELIADGGPEEISAVIEGITHPKRTYARFGWSNRKPSSMLSPC